MNRGIKTIGIILSLILLSVLLLVMLISTPFMDMPFGLKKGRLLHFSLTNYYFQQYLFWAAVVFAVLLVIVILVLIFYPRIKRNFILKEDAGTLSLDKKAIEGFVRSKLNEKDFVGTPKVDVRATKNKIKVKVKGKLTRTSSILGKTGSLMEEIRRELQEIVGTDEKVHVDVNYAHFDRDNEERETNHSRVE
ncbi:MULTISPECIES: alkaline shock response membrane anchor protein AmaP [unclassified Enterococcus]|jgi:flagellar biosynthesis/type III secretory pathway M-ring protein FliF/YscJ|uniref:alkaline shock response membrane anchor protein AmaP n=1 Tax=unclassified Enterococcus TaxID=2608891 RepID=UPI0004131FB7